ncbi:uncharacterized protein LOC119929902 isoform X2 [Tachyglossus aculeatus]|uniref:uncharacterized protein LOC119929902 isoform X2 n=1 Tax=Tachyglossus aculeatus TaxID=9261 RepID=UPI0018F51CA0|nr:uncharacterized protein LOC119929902 isoform X2 [Tachyglossus aculeatus]
MPLFQPEDIFTPFDFQLLKMTASARYLSRLSPLLLLLLQTKLQGTVLLSGPQKSLNAEERKVAAVGSSVLFLAPDIPSSIKIIQWEFINDLPLHVIVEYNSQDKSITVYPPFNDRIHFSPSNGSLLLNDVQKNDSGTYKAIINLDEQKARRTKLEVLGISPSLHLVQNLSAATLILVVVVGAGFIFHHYQVQTHGSDGWVIRYFISIHGLLALSAILLCSAAVKWMEEKGPSAVFVLLTLALIGVAVVAFTMFIVGACHPEKFPELQTKKSTHIILDFITRGGVILLLVSACFLITHIQELQEEGCSQHGNLATAFVITSVVMLVVACLVLVICLQWNHRKIKNPRRERRRGSQREVEEEEATSS